MDLLHNHPECTGRWIHQVISGKLFWRCDSCRRRVHHSDSLAEAALRENALGVTLRILADAGAWLLADNDEKRKR